MALSKNPAGAEKHLIEMLKKFSNDTIFILTARALLDNDEDRLIAIEAIESGEVRTQSEVLLMCLDLAQERHGEDWEGE